MTVLLVIEVRRPQQLSHVQLKHLTYKAGLFSFIHTFFPHVTYLVSSIQLNITELIFFKIISTARSFQTYLGS